MWGRSKLKLTVLERRVVVQPQRSHVEPYSTSFIHFKPWVLPRCKPHHQIWEVSSWHISNSINAENRPECQISIRGNQEITTWNRRGRFSESVFTRKVNHNNKITFWKEEMNLRLTPGESIILDISEGKWTRLYLLQHPAPNQSPPLTAADWAECLPSDTRFTSCVSLATSWLAHGPECVWSLWSGAASSQCAGVSTDTGP